MSLESSTRSAFKVPCSKCLVQSAFPVGVRAEPQPDIAVLPGSIREYVDQMPSEALLIVEVSDTTLANDRTWKKALYAQAGIVEYWIVNLNEHQARRSNRAAGCAERFGVGR